MILGAFISSSSAGFFATYLGRRQCLWLASILCCAANVVMMATTNLSGLYAGRFLIGLANGWYMTFSQLYIQVHLPHTPSTITIFETDTSHAGIDTSPLPRPHDFCLPMLDLHRHADRHGNRQRHPPPPGHGLVSDPARCNIHRSCADVHRSHLHPGVAAMATLHGAERTGAQGSHVDETLQGRRAGRNR